MLASHQGEIKSINMGHSRASNDKLEKHFSLSPPGSTFLLHSGGKKHGTKPSHFYMTSAQNSVLVKYKKVMLTMSLQSQLGLYKGLSHNTVLVTAKKMRLQEYRGTRSRKGFVPISASEEMTQAAKPLPASTPQHAAAETSLSVGGLIYFASCSWSNELNGRV